MIRFPFHQDTLMNRRRLESTSLAVAAVLLVAAGAGVLLVPHTAPWPGAVMALSAGWAITLLWMRRLYAQRDQAASAPRRSARWRRVN